MVAAESAVRVKTKARDSRGLKVLVAEDSSITSDLLKLLLSQRGHRVDIVTDGLQALTALQEQHYDVALLDFRLPQMDGVQVASSIKKVADGRKLPRLVAITGDIEALLSHSEDCENFDYILPKPLDIDQVGKLVEEQADIAARQTAPAPATLGRTTANPKPAPDKPSFFDSLGYKFLSWPGDLGTERLSARAMQATLGDPRFDAVLIKGPAAPEDLASIWRHKALHLLPVIDLTGTLGVKADLDGSKLGARETDELDRLIRRFHDQRARLHRDLVFPSNLGEQLLARMFVSDQPLKPAYDAQSATLVSYNTILSPRLVAVEAEAMCAQRFFNRSFYERFHLCQRCESSRLNVREECPKCRSSDLAEKSYLHHFTCAHQGPESAFRRGDELVCPKCRRELTAFSIDYDRPGAMMECNSCGHATSEPGIGFVCLDCRAHADGESCGTRDVFSYELTEEAIGLAQYGRSLLGDARQLLRFTELPIELVVALNAAAKRFNGEAIPFTLININYQNDREITAEHGARQFAQARELFLENLRAALASTDVLVMGQSSDFALLQGAGPEKTKDDFDRLRQHAQSIVRVDLGAKLHAFGPKDFT
jgi:CheY-like chemotaxis protein